MSMTRLTILATLASTVLGVALIALILWSAS